MSSLIILGLLCIALSDLQGQDFDFNLKTMEDSYLQETVELMVIREQSRSESRELKLLALSNIKDAIDRGITGGEIVKSLEYLGLENRRVRQLSYPDIREKAAMYLGELGSPEAKDVLIKMAAVEKETMVLTSVVTSLKKIGLNENQESVKVITAVLTHFNLFSPDNLLALSGLEAYEIFADQNGWKLDPASVHIIDQIAEGRYHGSIRLRAKQLLIRLRTYQKNK